MYSNTQNALRSDSTTMRERKRIARLLLTDVTATRTSYTITAHARLAGGQHRTLTLPVPEPAWKIRQTKASTHAEIAKLRGQCIDLGRIDVANHERQISVSNRRGRLAVDDEPPSGEFARHDAEELNGFGVFRVHNGITNRP